MPNLMLLTVVWDDMNLSMSTYHMYTGEIEELMENYEVRGQPELFSYLPLETLRQWMWDVYAREPYTIIVERINY